MTGQRNNAGLGPEDTAWATERPRSFSRKWRRGQVPRTRQASDLWSPVTQAVCQGGSEGQPWGHLAPVLPWGAHGRLRMLILDHEQGKKA